MAVDAFANEVVVDGPIGYWRFGESLGQPAADSSPNGNDGTYNGGITLGLPGFQGGDTAALFDGATGIVKVTNSPESQSAQHYDGGKGQVGRPDGRPAAACREGELRWDDAVRPKRAAGRPCLRRTSLPDRRERLQQRHRDEQ